MATIGKPIRLVNPSRRLTLLQKLHFGSKRQRAHAKGMLGKRNPSHKRGFQVGKGFGSRKIRKAKTSAQFMHYVKSQQQRRKKYHEWRLPNVGEIITVRPSPTHNPGSSYRGYSFGSSTFGFTKRKRGKKSKSMAKSHKRRLAGLKAARTRKRRLSARRASHNPGGVRHHRRRSYRRRYAHANASPVRHHRRRSYHRRRNGGYRRNPGFMSGDFGQALGIVAGAMVTKFAMGFVPASLASGIPGYIVTALVAALQGQAVGKLLKNPRLGRDMAIGGYVYLALRIAQDYMPNLGLPFSISGLGQMYGPSSFYTPQVPINGSMGQFVLPAAVRGAIPAVPVAAGMKGLGSMRRVGRMR